MPWFLAAALTTAPVYNSHQPGPNHGKKWHISAVGKKAADKDTYDYPVGLDNDQDQPLKSSIPYESVTEWVADSGGPIQGSSTPFPMHAACWKICRQEFFLWGGDKSLDNFIDQLGEMLSEQDFVDNGRGLVPSWSGDYKGPEQFYDDGWSASDDYGPPIDDSGVAQLLENAPEFDFLVCDPEDAEGFYDLFPNLPTAPNGEPRNVKTDTNSLENVDPFQKLPNELLLDILALLSSTAVREARISSRCFANARLDPAFWRYRFDQPHELSHVDVSRLSTDQKDSASVIDYRKLYERMIRAEGMSFRGWQNRKRISSLCHHLCSVLFQPQTPAQLVPDDTLAAGDSLSCPKGKPSTTASLDLRSWTGKNVIAHFKSLRHSHYLIGLVFEDSLGSVELGFCNENDARNISLEPQETIQAIEVGLEERGIVALTLIIANGHSELRTQSFGQTYCDASPDHPIMYGRLTPNDGVSVAGIELKFPTVSPYQNASNPLAVSLTVSRITSRCASRFSNRKLQCRS